MPAVRECMRLHEETVAEAAKHVRKRAKSKSKSSPVTKIKVDPRVWQTALELCQGDYTRIQVISSTEVVVLNPTH